MKPLGDAKQHYWLAQRMAKRAGVDLAQAYQAGQLDQQDWADIVETCRHCTWVDGCQRMLGEATDGEPPKTCLNCAEFEELTTAESSE